MSVLLAIYDMKWPQNALYKELYNRYQIWSLYEGLNMTRRTELYSLASFKICTLLWRGGIHAKRSASLSATLDQNDGPIEIFAIVLKPH